MERLKGNWRQTDSENYEDFISALGFNYVQKVAATVSAPCMEIDKTEEDGEWSMTTSTFLWSMEVHKFKLGIEFDEKTPDGRECSTMVTVQGDKLVIEQKPKNPDQKGTMVTYELKGLEGDECVKESQVIGEDLVCVEKFKRMSEEEAASVKNKVDGIHFKCKAYFKMKNSGEGGATIIPEHDENVDRFQNLLTEFETIGTETKEKFLASVQKTREFFKGEAEGAKEEEAKEAKQKEEEAKEAKQKEEEAKQKES